MVENPTFAPTKPKKKSGTPRNPLVPIDVIMFRTAAHLKTKPIGYDQKIGLLIRVCNDIFPEKVDSLRKNLGVPDSYWQPQIENHVVNPETESVYRETIQTLKKEKLVTNKPIKGQLRYGDGRFIIVQLLKDFQEKNPDTAVNLAEIAKQSGYTRARVSLAYNKYRHDHNLPPLKKQKDNNL